MAIKDAPAADDVRLPCYLFPWVSGTVELSMDIAHTFRRAVCEELRQLIVVDPLLERFERRTAGIGAEEVVVLETLENDEPVPVLPDEIRVITPPCAMLQSVEHIGDLLLLSARGGRFCFVCHNEQFLMVEHYDSAVTSVRVYHARFSLADAL